MTLYDKIVKIKRLKNQSGNRRGFVATATGDASIQPLADEPSELVEGQFATLYVAFVEVDLPAQAGDQVTDQEGNVYIVKDVHKRDTIPLPHQELILTKEPT